jgi:drug/metabolite transporter (DMT)-like permease
MKQERKMGALIALAGAVILWGASFSATGYLVERYNLWTIMWLRMIFASLAFLFIPSLHFKAQRQRGDWQGLLPLVILMPCAYFFLENTALVFTTSVQAGVISSVVPVFVTLGAIIYLKERVKPVSFLGLVLSMMGVIALTLLQGGENLAANPLLGNSLELMAMVCAAGSMLLIKQFSHRYNSFYITRMQCWAGLIFFLPGLFFLGPNFFTQLIIKDLLLLLFLGIGVSFGAFLLYNIALERMEASRASMSINLIPVVALIFGWFFRGEGLNTPQWLAAFLVLWGVLLSQGLLTTRRLTKYRA